MGAPGVYTQHRDEAKSLYVNKYWTYKEIADHFQIPHTTVKEWARRGKWATERDGLVADQERDLARRKSYTLNNLMTVSLDAITDGIKAAAKRGMTVEEIHQVSQVMANLDKLVRLANNQATDIVENRNLNATLPAKPLETQADIEAAFKIIKEQDPFAPMSEDSDNTNDNS